MHVKIRLDSDQQVPPVILTYEADQMGPFTLTEGWEVRDEYADEPEISLSWGQMRDLLCMVRAIFAVAGDDLS